FVALPPWPPAVLAACPAPATARWSGLQHGGARWSAVWTGAAGWERAIRGALGRPPRNGRRGRWGPNRAAAPGGKRQGVCSSPSGGCVARDEIAVFTFDLLIIPTGVTVRTATTPVRAAAGAASPSVRMAAVGWASSTVGRASMIAAATAAWRQAEA